MPENKEKEEAREILQAITKNGDAISKIAKNKNFKRSVQELNINFATPAIESLMVKGVRENKTQAELAESYYKQINEYLKRLDGFSEERKKTLDTQMNYATIAAGLLPLVLTLISGGFFVISDNLLSFLTNAFSVVPPLFINSIKGKIEGHYIGAKARVALKDLISQIERLVILEQFTEENQKKVDDELKKIRDDMEKL